jgi:GNAT superfamily N-acetyltransferase
MFITPQQPLVILLSKVERLEMFWHNLASTLPGATKIKGALVAHFPEIPIHITNHATHINVKEDEATNLIKRVTQYFSSRNFPYTCFRISPLTRPKSFSSLLKEHGFKKKADDSIMIFKGSQLEKKLNPEAKVKEISKREIDLYDKLLISSFEMPKEWKQGWDRLFLQLMQQGMKFYVAYVDKKPVGTSALLSIEKTGGIFNVGTLREYRRRGIGTTLTVHALLDSVEEGNNLHTLQTEAGSAAERLYKNIGFTIDHIVSFFTKEF